MTNERKHLVPGVELNKDIRLVSVVMGIFFVATMLLIAGWLNESLSPPGFFWVLFTLLKFVAASAASVIAGVWYWSMHPFKDVVVLEDGLLIGGAFVPFEDITKVESSKLSYRFHGADLKCSIGASLFSKVNLSELVKELKDAANLT